jgi:hypothetical protein
MKTWTFRAAFGVILIGSLAVREQASDVLVENGNLEAAVVRVGEAHGLVFRGYTTVADADIRAPMFDADRCAGPVLVIPWSVTFEQEAIMRSAFRPHDIRDYVYLDRSWKRPHRLAVFAERSKYAALAALGLSRYVPSQHMLLVERPPECRLAETVDWRPVWNRDYLAGLREPNRKGD